MYKARTLARKVNFEILMGRDELKTRDYYRICSNGICKINSSMTLCFSFVLDNVLLHMHKRHVVETGYA